MFNRGLLKSIERKLDLAEEREANRHAEMTEFMREQTLRMEMAANRQEQALKELLERFEVNTRRILERLEDQGESIRANTQAVLSILDRLPPP